MATPLRKWLLAFAATVVLVLALVFGLVLSTPSPSALPNPNGYDDFMRAGSAVSGDLSIATEFEREALRGLVSTNAEPLRLVRLGLTRQCSFPTQVALTNFIMVATNLAKLRSLAQLLRAEGRLAEMEGRPFDAAGSYVDALRLGNEVSRGGLILNRLVGIAVEAIGATSLAKLVPQLGSDRARPLLSQLAQLDAHRVNFDEIRRNEKVYMRHELLQERNPVKWVAGWWQARGLIEHSETRHKIVIAHERLLAVEIALRCYRASEASPPVRLQELTPNYLSTVPADPFSSMPLVYRPQGTNWLLYSVGPDGVDDGGLPITRGGSPKGDIFFDSPW